MPTEKEIYAPSIGVGFKPAFMAAVLETIQIFNSEANVLEFGAVGDGVTDDTVAIQKAIDTVASAGGGTVVFPAPAVDYVITTLTLRRGVSLLGRSTNGSGSLAAGDFYVQLRQRAGYVGTALIADYPADTSTPNNRITGVNLQSLALRNTDVGNANTGVSIAFAAWCSVQNFRVVGFDVGIALKDCWDFYWTNVLITNVGVGLSIPPSEVNDNTNNLYAYHLHIETWTREAVDIQGSVAGHHNKLYFYGLKCEGAPDGTGVAGIRLAGTRSVFVAGGHCSTTAAAAPPATFPLIELAGDTIGTTIIGFNLANNGAQVGSYIRFTQALIAQDNSGSWIHVDVSNTALAPTDGVLAFEAGNVDAIEIALTSYFDGSGAAALTFKNTAIISNTTIRDGNGQCLTKPIVNADGVVNTEPGYAIKTPGATNTWYMGRGTIAANLAAWRLLNDDTVILSVGGDNRARWQEDVMFKKAALPAGPTPSIIGGNVFTVANGGATAITNFLNGEAGGFFIVKLDANTTITNNANIVTKSGANIAASAVAQFYTFDGVVWYEI